MNVYSFWAEEGYAVGLNSVEDDAIEKHGLLDAPNPCIQASWSPLETYISNPLLKIPDFYYYGKYLCCSIDTLAKVHDSVATDVKCLPVMIEGRPEQYVLLYPINVLDSARAEEIDRRITQQGSFRPAHYLFRRDAFKRPQLFLCKTHFHGQLFCASGLGDPQKDFYLRYKELGLTGIDFRCVDQPKD